MLFIFAQVAQANAHDSVCYVFGYAYSSTDKKIYLSEITKFSSQGEDTPYLIHSGRPWYTLFNSKIKRHAKYKKETKQYCGIDNLESEDVRENIIQTYHRVVSKYRRKNYILYQIDGYHVEDNKALSKVDSEITLR